MGNKIAVRFVQLSEEFPIVKLRDIEPDRELAEFLTREEIEAKLKSLIATGKYPNQIGVTWDRQPKLLAISTLTDSTHLPVEIVWLHRSLEGRVDQLLEQKKS